MSFKPGNGDLSEKHAAAAPGYEPALESRSSGSDPENLVVGPSGNVLHQDLKGRHMQMIAMQVQPAL